MTVLGRGLVPLGQGGVGERSVPHLSAAAAVVTLACGVWHRFAAGCWFIGGFGLMQLEGPQRECGPRGGGPRRVRLCGVPTRVRGGEVVVHRVPRSRWVLHGGAEWGCRRASPMIGARTRRTDGGQMATEAAGWI